MSDSDQPNGDEPTDPYAETDARLAERGFQRGNLVGADLAGVRWRNIFLEDVSLSQANLTGAGLESARLARCDLKSAILHGAHCQDADFTQAQIVGASLQRADLSRADFTGVNLSKSDLTGAQLVGACLEGTNIDGCNFFQANLEDVVFNPSQSNNINLTQARFKPTNRPPSDATRDEQPDDWEPLPIDRDTSQYQDMDQSLGKAIEALEQSNGYARAKSPECRWVVGVLKTGQDILREELEIFKGVIQDMLKVINRAILTFNAENIVGAILISARDSISTWLQTIIGLL